MNSYLTFDVGGSAIKYALIQEDLTILEKDKVPTPMDTLEHFIDVIGNIYDQYKDRIKGIAMSLPGIIDPKKGINYTGGALNYIHNLNTVKTLQKRCPLPITIGNDAKCAANAEVGFGSLKDVNDGAVVILGTGIGGCLVKDHKIHIGQNFLAGEFSSIKTDYHSPNDPQNNWSKRCGIAGLLSRVQEQLHTDQTFTGHEIFAMANEGNKDVIEALKIFAREIATQIMNIHVIFDCEKVAIGGGISAQPILLTLIREQFDDLVNQMGYDVKPPKIVTCQFYNDANLIGALYQHLNQY